jgi:hypothetical protein
MLALVPDKRPSFIKGTQVLIIDATQKHHAVPEQSFVSDHRNVDHAHQSLFARGRKCAIPLWVCILLWHRLKQLCL